MTTTSQDAVPAERARPSGNTAATGHCDRRQQTPLEMCTQIVSEHAASTISALNQRRAARLAAELEDYATALLELADEIGHANVPQHGEPYQHGDSRP
jgi:hypothetical protein